MSAQTIPFFTDEQLDAFKGMLHVGDWKSPHALGDALAKFGVPRALCDVLGDQVVAEQINAGG